MSYLCISECLICARGVLHVAVAAKMQRTGHDEMECGDVLDVDTHSYCSCSKDPHVLIHTYIHTYTHTHTHTHK